jgi:hypothetical protein
MEPALPKVAKPVPTLTAPLFPLLELPELNMSIPLAPDEPALTLRIETIPLLDESPSPLEMLKKPPVFDECWPA